MCGRFLLTSSTEAVSQIFNAVPVHSLQNREPNPDIRPTQNITVITSSPANTRQMTQMRWGFLPQWYTSPSDGPLLINARSETLAEKPAFRSACRERRCLIPADGFYEWQAVHGQRKKRVHLMQPSAGGIIAFAGIWQEGQSINGPIKSVAIVTVAASQDVSHIHHRLPLTIGHNDWPLWLGEAGKGAARLMVTPLEGYWQASPDIAPPATDPANARLL